MACRCSTRYAQAYPELAREFTRAAERKLPEQWGDIWQRSVPHFDPATPMATREAQGKLLDALMPQLPLVIGGSADLTPSNNTRFKGAADFSRDNPSRAGMSAIGVREHAMGAIINGIALSDMLIPYGATFFVFLDYMRPAVRLAAVSKYPAIFVYTHDSIGLGEDGPTHQAVEQFARCARCRVSLFSGRRTPHETAACVEICARTPRRSGGHRADAAEDTGDRS